MPRPRPGPGCRGPTSSEHLTRLFRRYEMTPPNDPTLGGDFDKALAVQAVVVGSPATIRAHVEQFEAESGTDYFVGCFSWGDIIGDDLRRSFRSLRRARGGAPGCRGVRNRPIQPWFRPPGPGHRSVAVGRGRGRGRYPCDPLNRPGRARRPGRRTVGCNAGPPPWPGGSRPSRGAHPAGCGSRPPAGPWPRAGR